MKIFMLILGIISILSLKAVEFTSGYYAIAYEINKATKSIRIIAETAYDPNTEEGDSVYTLYWNDKTNFQVQKSVPFTSIKPGTPGLVYLTAKEAQKVKKLQSFFTNRIEFSATKTKNIGFRSSQLLDTLIYPLSKRKGEIVFNNQKIKFTAPEKVTVFSKGTIDDIKLREYQLRIFGKKIKNKFVITRVNIVTKPNTEKLNPVLPNALIIGDSISMNYESSLKLALDGKMNCQRIDGNSGDSNRGNSALQLWLGDIPGQKSRWNVVVVNHGLHDLKQKYDSKNKKYAPRHQVEPEVYAKNIDRILKYLTSRNYKIVWCTTTPVPGNSYGTFARRKDEDLIYNKALEPILKKYPQVIVCDLNTLVRKSKVFDKWKTGNNVHFNQKLERKLLGDAVAAAILKAFVQK